VPATTLRRSALWIVLLLTIASCGDDGTSILDPNRSTTTLASSTSAAPTTVVPTTATPTTQPPATTLPPTTQPPTTQASTTTQGSEIGGGGLDWTLEAWYDEFDLASGFDPDPWDSGGIIAGSTDSDDVSYLGGSCVGYANQNPEYEVDYQDGGYSASLLRFYFVADDANEDTILVINAPDGSWYCGDDSYGSANPTVDFPNPTYGVYDVWIGTYDEQVLVNGVLYITELDTNHP
jgi:hypothetical protein